MNRNKSMLSILFILVFYSTGFSQALFIDSGQKLGETSCWSVTLQDLNGDKIPDACIDGQFWINYGKGVFTKSNKSIGTGSPVTFGDLNGDGFIDAVCNSNIYLNDGHWNFVKQNQTFGKGVIGAWLLDLDNDGDLDAIVYTINSDQIWYNDGKGNFTNSGKSFGGWGQCKYSIGDINGDGFTDVVVAFPHTAPPELNDNVNDKIWLGDGKGNFTEKVLLSVNFQTRSAILADFNGDGCLDILLAKGYSGADGDNWSKILFNDGKGNFTDSGQRLNSGYNSPDAKVADLNGDGYPDIFFANGMPGDNGQPNTIWLNDGKGNFTDSGLRLGSSNSIAVALGDIDGDGDIDALVANVDIKTNKAFTNVYFNTTKTSTGIKKDGRLGTSFHIDQNYPDRFNLLTLNGYKLPVDNNVKLKIYDVPGREVKTLVDSFQSSDEHSIIWNAKDKSNNDVSSGIFFCKMGSNGMSFQKEMILVQ